jgi:signal transduction histidine kinase
MSGHRYRQLFLFGLVLILPSIAILVASRKIAIQDEKTARQEAQQRAAVERKRAVEDVGKDLLARLERIKLQEIVSAADRLPEPSAYSDPAIAAIGWVDDGERLVWPWDFGGSPGHSEFTRAMDEGARAEFGDKFYELAVEVYRQAVFAAPSDAERAAAQLGLARALWRAGTLPDAVGVYRDLLKLPSNVADEYGLAFASYAVEPLLELGAPEGDELDRIDKEVRAPEMLTRVQANRWKSALAHLSNSKNLAVRRGAVEGLEHISGWLTQLDQAAALQADFRNLRLTSDGWQAYRPTPQDPLWLISRAPAGAAARPLVLAVRADSILQDLKPQFEITAGSDSGELLNPRLAGLRANFSSPVETEIAISSRAQRSLWGLSFVLTVTLTFVLGFLLWRDTRRDVHLAELRTQFVSSVSHELKTPLTSIRMFAEILQMRHVDAKRHDEYLETIVSESERLTRLLNNVLDFSRIERGQKTYRLEQGSLAEVIRSTVRTIQYPLAEQGFTLALDIADDLPPVSIDRDGMQQAVLNLLTNAMKYSGKRRDIELRLSRDGQAALIEVTDHGIGIPEKEQTRIFEKFYRAQVPENRAISGTGLGLALVAHIASAHGGGVHVRSKQGEGSTFSLRIPIRGGEAVAAPGGPTNRVRVDAEVQP